MKKTSFAKTLAVLSAFSLLQIPYAAHAEEPIKVLIDGVSQQYDSTDRLNATRAAESQLLQDAVILPLTHTSLLALQKPYVHGYSFYPTLPAFDLKYVTVNGN